MFDEMQNRIIDAAMELIMEKGYSAATTRDIAKKAGINECTIFRKFKGKKEIVLSAMELPKWNPKLSEEDFSFVAAGVIGDLLFPFPVGKGEMHPENLFAEPRHLVFPGAAEAAVAAAEPDGFQKVCLPLGVGAVDNVDPFTGRQGSRGDIPEIFQFQMGDPHTLSPLQ